MTNDKCFTKQLIPLDEALNTIEKSITALDAKESIHLNLALDRIAYTENYAKINVPQFNNSAMDGYALQSQDFNSTAKPKLTPIGTAFAGKPFEGEIASEECVRIMTGARLPQGADAVVMQEETEVVGEKIKINSKHVRGGKNIRLAGEDIANGDVIVPKNKRLNPTDIGLLASTGIHQIEVYRKLNIALFATGNELKTPSEKLSNGAIYESNRFVISAMLSRLNFDITDLGIIGDSREQLEEAFSYGTNNCDAIISTGGASVGDSDLTRQVFASIGNVNLYQLAIKPGKPFSFGNKNNAYYFGLPGNPVSAALTFHQLVIPALRKLSGEGFIHPQTFVATAKNAIVKKPGRTDFQRGIFEVSDEAETGIFASAMQVQGSGVLSSFSKANCFIKIEAERGNVAAGEKVTITPFDRWIS